MESQLGVLLVLALVVASWGQESCSCATNKWTVCAQGEAGTCSCTLLGSHRSVDCSTLTSKCLLMKAEMTRRESERFVGDNGIYDPDCEESGTFKARQCKQGDTCWCVNSAGVIRSERGDRSLTCSELIRTSWIHMQLKHRRIPCTFEDHEVASALAQLFQNRYQLPPECIAGVKYDAPFIQIRLKQNEKYDGDVDIADVAYYFKKDIENNSIFHANNKLSVSVNGKALDIENILIYYIDEKPPQFSARRMICSITVMVTLIVIFVVTVLVVLLWQKRRNCCRVEI